MLYNVNLTKHILNSYNKGEAVDVLVAELRDETRNPSRENNKIDFGSFNWEQPNLNPWNQLGIKLIEDNKFNEAEYLFTEMLVMINEVAARDGKYPEIGLPYNNLGVIYAKSGLYDKAIECYKKAYTYDSQMGNYESLAMENLESLIKELSYRAGAEDARKPLNAHRKSSFKYYDWLLFSIASICLFIIYKVWGLISFEVTPEIFIKYFRFSMAISLFLSNSRTFSMKSSPLL